MPNLKKQRKAGKILSKVRSQTKERVKKGSSVLDVAKFAEEKILEMGGKPAFPVNISINEEAAHSTPKSNDTSVFGEDMVNLDIGVHIDGWIADSATTVDLSGNEGMAEVAERALEAAIEKIEAGISTAEIGQIIENNIKESGFSPVYNLTGHGLGHYKQHDSPSIPNKSVDKGSILEKGKVIAIEPFVTDGRGKVNEGSKKQIYGLKENFQVRSRRAKKLVKEIEEKYGNLPFAKRWIDQENLINRLEEMDVLRSYPVLKEKEDKYVAQAEHTILIKQNGCEVLTR